MRDQNLPVTENTSFRIASLTKPVFAYLCHKLMIARLFDLDTPLLEYFGAQYIQDDHIGELTARHILSHQSGFPNWAWKKPLNFEFPPGKSFQYSGEGYIYLQHTIEKLTGIKTHQLAEELVFQPLGMKSSALTPIFLRTKNRTYPHSKKGEKSIPRIN